jgi:hypothetical protein
MEPKKLKKSERLELNPDAVKRALKLAVEGTDRIYDFCDTSQPYLVLRVRGHAASWLVKTRDRTIKIGDAMDESARARLPERRKRGKAANQTGLREARTKAKSEWAKMGGASTKEPAPPKGWTWGELVTAYRKYLSEMREDAQGKPIYPSRETQNDVRLCFDRPLVAKWSDRPLASLTTEWFEDVQEVLHKKHGFDAYRKFRAYGNAALNWAQDFERKKSGLDGRRWWLLAEKRRRTSEEVTAKLERDEKLSQKKAAFQVDHLAALLIEHEKFCLSRTGNQRISPGVRWGLWWDSLTGHRRGSGTQVAFEDVEFKDPRGNPGWGLVTWRPEVMKTQDAFTLPIPPLGLHIVRCCMRDWKEAAEKAGMKARNSKWVFASRVVQSMAGDIAVTGSAMANHIRNLRGLRKGNHNDVIKRIPAFSMHIVRSTMGDYILEESGLPAGTASLMIGHEIAGDRKSELDRVGQTGKRWYFQAQRVPEKTRAMEQWSEALLTAYKKAGGLYPA